MLFVIVLMFTTSFIYFVFAQSDIENTTNIQVDKSNRLDDTLTPTITATLTGLSLTGGTFLVNLSQRTNENISNHIHLARKSFIRAFFMFLICTIVLFAFDFLEIVDEKNISLYALADVVASYALFGIGAMNLVIAAKHLYSTYGK